MAYHSYLFEGAYSCGHEGKVREGGSTEEYAKEKADEKFKGLCPDCAKKAREAYREKEHEKAVKRAEELDFPALKGTEKQVKRAETLRILFFDGICDTISKMEHRHVMLVCANGVLIAYF